MLLAEDILGIARRSGDKADISKQLRTALMRARREEVEEQVATVDTGTTAVSSAYAAIAYTMWSCTMC